MTAVAERPQRAATSAGMAWAPAAVTITAAGLSLARLAATGDPFRTVWGEDGTVFLAEAKADPAGSIITTYAGYAHLAPRLVALAGSVLPVSWWAAFATLTSVAAVGALAGFVFVAAKRITGRARAALVAAAGLPLAGALRWESLGSVANLQWFLICAAFWALLLRRGPGAGVVTGLASATSPLAVLVTPALLTRPGRRGAALWGLCAGLAFQVLAALAGPVSAVHLFDRHLGLPDHFGWLFISSVAGTGEWPEGLLPGTFVLCVVAWLVMNSRSRAVYAAVLSCAAVYAVPTLLTGLNTGRYQGAAGMLLFTVAALALPAVTWRTEALAVGLLVSASVLGFAAAPYRMGGPSWRDDATRFEQACAAGHNGGTVAVGPVGTAPAMLRC